MIYRRKKIFYEMDGKKFELLPRTPERIEGLVRIIVDNYVKMQQFIEGIEKGKVEVVPLSEYELKQELFKHITKGDHESIKEFDLDVLDKALNDFLGYTDITKFELSN